VTGNRTNRSDAPRGYIPGEKPVLNEKWEFPDAGPLGEIERRQARAPQTVKAKDTGEAVPADSRFKKGMRLFLMKRWESALEEFLHVEPESFSSEERIELAYYVGLCCTKLERFDDALMYLEQVIAVADSPLRVYQCRMILAYIYIMTERAPLAEAELNRLQGSGLESVMLYNTLAYAAYIQKHYLGAMEYYEKALEIDNDNTTALNSLGFILADAGFDKLKGLRLCRKAVDRNPENAAYLDSLGWASYKCGNIKDARSWLRKALDIAPQEKEIIEHFGIVNGGAV
jgi:tetratricopeptide (TPR) repeat protein